MSHPMRKHRYPQSSSHRLSAGIHWSSVEWTPRGCPNQSAGLAKGPYPERLMKRFTSGIRMIWVSRNSWRPVAGCLIYVLLCRGKASWVPNGLFHCRYLWAYSRKLCAPVVVNSELLFSQITPRWLLEISKYHKGWGHSLLTSHFSGKISAQDTWEVQSFGSLRDLQDTWPIRKLRPHSPTVPRQLEVLNVTINSSQTEVRNK